MRTVTPVTSTTLAPLRQPPSRRKLHSLPPLPANLSKGDGCEPLFSAQTIKLLWDDWHAGLLGKLNDEVRGTPWENSSIVETIIGTAQDPQHVQAFNYASLALNNSFFLSGLQPKELPAGVSHWADVSPPKPQTELMDDLEKHFDSLPAFKLAFSSAAYGMSSSGYVWLVRDRHDNLGIVPTFGAGTVLVQNRQQREPAGSQETKASVVQDSAKEGSDAMRASQSGSPSAPRTSGPGGLQARPFSTSAALRSVVNDRHESMGEELFPLLCVSVHERDWLPDYGMWGKEEYLMRFWECVDWARVQRLNATYRVY